MNGLRKSALAIAALALLAGASAPAVADRGWHGHGGDWHGHAGGWHRGGDWDRGGGRVHFGFYLGAPFGYPNWYDWPPAYSPYYYPPNVVVVPSSPPVYVQQPQATPEAAQHWWYYCRDSKSYYPYVKHCPGGWQRVAPQPPPG